MACPAHQPLVMSEAEVEALPHEERLRGLARALDDLEARTTASMGAEDIAQHQRVRRFSFSMELCGRAALYVSVLPFALVSGAFGWICFGVGVLCLAAHKQLAWELHHTTLHGAFDRLPGAEGWSSKATRWDLPIDEESWRRGHNVLHHGATNVAGIDADMALFNMRLSEHVPWRPRHRYQMWILFGLVATNFGVMLNGHFTGVNGAVLGPDGVTLAKERNAPREAWRRALRKLLPYYAKNYLFFPALAGAMFWKVLLGNLLAEFVRDVYSALTFTCGHVGGEKKSWPVGTRARQRGEWYAMQLEATSNFEVSLPLSLLCGGVDRHIEHHLFPRLPPHRLRQIAPEVRTICEKYGFPYRTSSWPRAIYNAVSHLAALARGPGPRHG